MLPLGSGILQHLLFIKLRTPIGSVHRVELPANLQVARGRDISDQPRLPFGGRQIGADDAGRGSAIRGKSQDRRWFPIRSLANDGQDQAAPVLREALGLAQLHDSRTELVPYPLIVPAPNSPHAGQQRIKMRDVLVDQADEQLGDAMAQSLAHRASLVGELRALGGAVARVPAHATAWGSRHQEVLAATWIHPLGIAEQDQSFAALQVLGTGAYGAYSSDVRRSAAELAWPGQTGTRLRALSERTDPQHLFDGGLNLRSQNSSAT
ncbi:hypothetical protein D3C74_45980 [compost metagenome]